MQQQLTRFMDTHRECSSFVMSLNRSKQTIFRMYYDPYNAMIAAAAAASNDQNMRLQVS